MVKLCSKCNRPFPTRLTINGKRHNLINRKNCLSCVPFKSKDGTGKQYSNWSEERKIRHRAVAAAKGLKRKQQLLEYKGGRCIICGYNKCSKALQLHHRDPNKKLFELCISEIRGKNWDSVLKEADKCDLICANCHFEIHAKEFSHYINVVIGTVPGEGQTNFPCVKCGADRKHRSPNNLCNKCSKENQRKVERPPVKVLLQQIKEFGYCGTGRIYGVSDNAIRKWLRAYASQ